MNAIGVNISVHKTFRHLAEELLTRKTQFIHELLTELSAAANQACGKLKRDREKRLTIAQHNTLCCAVITGYRLGVLGHELPLTTDALAECEQTVKYLALPYVTLGYQTACRQIELMILRGHHRSQTAKPTV